MTISKEDYLKAIYKLSKNQKISNKNLSQYLNIKPSSVTEMIKKLEKFEYIKYENKEIILTDLGEKIAVQTIRKHRVWETFLHNVLNYNLDEVHEEAEKLEHVTNDKLLYKLEKYLFFPDDVENSIQNENRIMKLSECNVGDKIVIISHEKNIELKKYLEEKGLKLKNIYKIVEKNDFDDLLILKSNDDIEKFVGKKAREILEVYKMD